ncbi:anti-sigma factor family protein [Ruania zhangjianzhongii]|uniref:anti-sigma factor family protein n=1 Tax=Ruania zhangjianzhongii TaxID=2603206 RepID=UPI0011C8E605|nr:hypothetical protein [Ruania zhangjianzhongii]
MTEPTHPAEDDLVTLALGHLDPGQSPQVTEHLATCAGCRAHYDEVAASIALVLPAAPRTSPPVDFEVTVLDRLRSAHQSAGNDRASTPEAGTRDAPRRHLLLVAAAAALGVVLGVGGGAIAWWPGGEQEPTATSAWQAPLVAADGQDVGRVARSYSADGPVLVLEVIDGPAGQSYTCRLVRGDGSTEDVAHWELSDQRPNSWVIEPGSDAELRQVQLIGADGQVWSSADL